MPNKHTAMTASNARRMLSLRTPAERRVGRVEESVKERAGELGPEHSGIANEDHFHSGRQQMS